MGESQGKSEATRPGQLTHEETLEWVNRNRAWRRVRKTKPVWARPVEPDEVGRSFVTADHAVQEARAGYWLCVGVAGEPWFQELERLEAKYGRAGEEQRRFAFDQAPHSYVVFRPKGESVNWAARVAGPGVDGFFIRPSYDCGRPLYSPAGGYVVKDHSPDPYQPGGEVWLVQERLFETTYEVVP